MSFPKWFNKIQNEINNIDSKQIINELLSDYSKERAVELQTELENLLSHYKKLKFNLLEMDTKKNFLKRITTLELKLLSQEDRIKIEEEEIEEIKIQQKEIKKKIEQSKNNCRNISNNIVKLETQINKAVNELLIDFKELKHRLEQRIDISEMIEINKKLEEEISKIKKEIEKLSEKIRKMEFEKKIENLKSPKLIKKISREKSMEKWYGSMCKIMNDVGGVYIMSQDQDSSIILKLIIHSIEVLEYNVKIDLNNWIIKSISIEPDDFPYKDIEEYSIQEQVNIKFVIVELRKRADCYRKRKQEIANIASSGIQIRADKTAETILVTTNQEYLITIDHDYPDLHSKIHCNYLGDQTTEGKSLSQIIELLK